METKVKKRTHVGEPKKQSNVMKQKPKSTYTLFREKHPNGIGEIVNMRAVLR
ncbi:MAG: hypothetical protein LBS08_05585 [Candidatus Symbiothrix sp.]|nr:hypothetical protein [Candidatus Symbiothrix sp.]